MMYFQGVRASRDLFWKIRRCGSFLNGVRSRSYYHSGSRSSGHHAHKPHLLLCGGIAFAWERERISNDDVKSYLESCRPSSSSNNRVPSTTTKGTTSTCHLPSITTEDNASRHHPSAPSPPTDMGNGTYVSRDSELKGRDSLFLQYYHTQLATEQGSWLVEEEEQDGYDTMHLLSQTLRVLEGVRESTWDRLLSLFTSASSEDLVEGVGVDECLEGNSHPDLACAGMSFEMGQQAHVFPIRYSVEWTKCYMQLEQDGDDPPGTLSDESNLLSKKVELICDHVKSLSATSQHYLKDQFLIEEYFLADSAAVDAFNSALETAKGSVRDLVTEVLDRFHEESLVLNRKRKELNFEPEVGVEVKGWVQLQGFDVNKGEGVSLCVISEEMAKVVSVQRRPATATAESGALSGWEYINGDSDYAAYRKLYKDTGLFQYKVIGRFRDITARDFFEAQVDNEFRKTWDIYAGDMDVVNSDSETNCKLIHWIMKYPFPMSDREYLFVRRSWISPEEDTIVIMNKSASHPGVSGNRRHVQVTDYFSHMVIRAHSQIDRVGMDFEIHYFDNPHSQLPSSCVNWVASSAMPDFMIKIHTAALTRRTKPSSL